MHNILIPVYQLYTLFVSIFSFLLLFQRSDLLCWATAMSLSVVSLRSTTDLSFSVCVYACSFVFVCFVLVVVVVFPCRVLCVFDARRSPFIPPFLPSHSVLHFPTKRLLVFIICFLFSGQYTCVSSCSFFEFTSLTNLLSN